MHRISLPGVLSWRGEGGPRSVETREEDGIGRCPGMHSSPQEGSQTLEEVETTFLFQGTLLTRLQLACPGGCPGSPFWEAAQSLEGWAAT